MFSLRFMRPRGTIKARETMTPALMIITPENGLAVGSCSATQIKDGCG